MFHNDHGCKNKRCHYLHQIIQFFSHCFASLRYYFAAMRKTDLMKHPCLIVLLLTFVFPSFAQQRHELVISEIMADPSPAVGLPSFEWIEIYNCSDHTIDMAGLRIGDASGTSNPLPAFQLAPGAFVLAGSVSASTALRIYGDVLGVSNFPSLDNEGDLIVLKTAGGTTLHAVRYEAAWYGSELKKEGGWTLEMIDPERPCAGKSNWSASISTTGGTPGRINSVKSVLIDDSPPRPLWAIAVSPDCIQVQFNEPVDNAAASAVNKYSINDRLPSAIEVRPPLFDQVLLCFNTPFEEGKMYDLHLADIPDCSGNLLVSELIRTGRAASAQPRDIVINEILFNPRPGAQDYVELYNNSNKVIDMAALHLANRGSNGQAAGAVRLSTVNRPFFPGDYHVLTTDPDGLALQYTIRDIHAVQRVSPLPSYPDDKGTVLLLDGQGLLLDEVNYDEKWHFPLLSDREGVSLERLAAGQPSGQSGNWHSAAASAGYGTPGYINSQQLQASTLVEDAISVDTEIFSPDQDGWQDILNICYRMPEPGYVANLYVYDATGVKMRHLVKNEVLGNEGCWKWDGLDHRLQPLPIGQYILYAEWFNLQGKRQQSKQVVVLARRLR